MKAGTLLPATLRLVALMLLSSVSSQATQAESLHYAFEAFDPHGMIIATGRLKLDVYDQRDDGTIPLFAARRHERLYWRQNDFFGSGESMQGSVEGDRITLVPSIFADAGYIRIEGRFTGHRFGAFDGYWWHKHNTRTGYGEFRAWPISHAPSAPQE